MTTRTARRAAAILLGLVAGFPTAGCKKPAEDSKAPPAAAAANTNSPRGAGLAFAKAVRAGDVAAARKVSTGSDASYETLKLMSDTWKAMDAFVAAVRTHVPDALADKEMVEMRSLIGLHDDLDAEAARAVESIAGETATLTEPVKDWPPTKAAPKDPSSSFSPDVMPSPPGEFADPEPMMLKRVNGQWLVDVDATLAKKGLDKPAAKQFWSQVRDGFTQRAAAVKPGMTKRDVFRGL